MNFDITAIVGALLTLLSAVITCLLVPWLKNKTTAEQLAMIRIG